MDFLSIIGERIRSRILGSDEYMSIEKFAHENGIPKSTLSELLNGKNDPKLTTLAKICAGLEITLSDLLQDARIDSWVREKAPDYDPRSGRRPAARSARKSPRRK